MVQELRIITIMNAKYINDDSIGYLCSYTRDKLIWLKLGRCNNVTDEVIKGVVIYKILAKHFPFLANISIEICTYRCKTKSHMRYPNRKYLGPLRFGGVLGFFAFSQ